MPDVRPVSRRTSRPAARPALDVERIVDATCAAIAADGLARLSMRRLGARLGVDPMAVYHHVANKQALLALVMARVMTTMPLPDDDGPWASRVREWAGAYWDVVVANRDLVGAALADPVIAEGAMPMVAPLRSAVAASGLAAGLVEPNVHLVVDFVHGSALGTAGPSRHGPADPDPLRAHFELGLDTVVAGIAALAANDDAPGASA